eukprot:TRINITY_DN12072_c3_g1_i1.p1 TRINITY_DN12072_c3_g1~~TRINITY_DN12072_c3_g1_i1.p1  ORF type:complete len:250 (+),score=42.12 TRINITY_DN12072_c3_g1_i1:135-884(+)
MFPVPLICTDGYSSNYQYYQQCTGTSTTYYKKCTNRNKMNKQKNQQNQKQYEQSWSEPNLGRLDFASSDDDQNSVAASAVSDPVDKRHFVLCKIENGRYVKATTDEAEQLAFALEQQLVQQKYKKQKMQRKFQQRQHQQLKQKQPSSYYHYLNSNSPRSVMDGFHKMQYKKGGPCDQCAVTETPQWRRGPPEKPTLCNACGTRYRRTGRLELSVSRGIKRKFSSGQIRGAGDSYQNCEYVQNVEIEVFA